MKSGCKSIAHPGRQKCAEEEQAWVAANLTNQIDSPVKRWVGNDGTRREVGFSVSLILSYRTSALIRWWALLNHHLGDTRS
jgi:hypothetical protein